MHKHGVLPHVLGIHIFIGQRGEEILEHFGVRAGSIDGFAGGQDQ